MGCPEKYYKKILCNTVRDLSWEDIFIGNHEYSVFRNLTLENCTSSIEELEINLLSFKDKLPIEKFYYICGTSAMKIVSESVFEGGDSMNACCGGLCAFEEFIGLEEAEDD